MADSDSINSDYITIATALLFFGVLSSYVTLFVFSDIPLQRFWFGLNKIGIPVEIMMIPIGLSGIGFVYFFVYSLFLIDERDNHMILSLQFMYLGANLWATFLYTYMKVSKFFKWPTILSLWVITITSSIILYRIVDMEKAGQPYELIGILLGVCVVGQSIIDSVFWSIGLYFD